MKLLWIFIGIEIWNFLLTSRRLFHHSILCMLMDMTMFIELRTCCSKWAWTVNLFHKIYVMMYGKGKHNMLSSQFYLSVISHICHLGPSQRGSTTFHISPLCVIFMFCFYPFYYYFKWFGLRKNEIYFIKWRQCTGTDASLLRMGSLVVGLLGKGKKCHLHLICMYKVLLIYIVIFFFLEQTKRKRKNLYVFSDDRDNAQAKIIWLLMKKMEKIIILQWNVEQPL